MRPAKSWFKAEALWIIGLSLALPLICLLLAYLIRLTF